MYTLISETSDSIDNEIIKTYFALSYYQANNRHHLANKKIHKIQST